MKKTLISRTSRANTYDSKYQNFQITKFCSLKELICKFNSFAFHHNAMGSISFWCLSSNLTQTLKLLNSEFVAQTETLKYHLPQIITPNGKKTSHLLVISRAK